MAITRKRSVEGTQIPEESQKLVEADLLSSSSSEAYAYTASEDDDDEDDPTFDETQSKFSRLSLSRKTKTKTKSRMINDVETEETVVPVLNEKDAKSFETVLEIVNAGQVEELKLEQCKVYLRKYGLRLTGKKETLIMRITEHIEIQNGGGEKKYPASSFVFNCKGDACLGDVVMFEQKVYEMFNIASRSASGPPCGTRIVAGRIVKESYGAAKQQHTFTIEVLWSKGEKPLPPLHPLLIKGRNLYRLMTLRQKWEDEGERQKVLMEKHSRGGVARSDREVRFQKKEIRKTFKANRVFKEIDPKTVQVPVKLSSSSNSGKVDIQYQQKPMNINNVQQVQYRHGNPAIPLNNFHPSTTDCGKLANSKGSSWVLATSSTGSMVHVSARSHSGQLPKVDEVQISLQPKLSVKVHPVGSKNQRCRLESSSIGYQFPLGPRHEVPCERTNQYLMHPKHGRVTNPQYVPLSPRYDQPSETQHHDLVLPSHNVATGPRYGQLPPRNNNCNPRVTPWVNQSHHKEQSCRYYAQGRCYYGDNCKFLHENR